MIILDGCKQTYSCQCLVYTRLLSASTYLTTYTVFCIHYSTGCHFFAKQKSTIPPYFISCTLYVSHACYWRKNRGNYHFLNSPVYPLPRITNRNNSRKICANTKMSTTCQVWSSIRNLIYFDFRKINYTTICFCFLSILQLP